MNGMASLSDQAWAEFVAAAQESLARWGFRPRPVGLPLHTDALALALCADGLGSLVVYRGGRVDYGSHWPEQP